MFITFEGGEGTGKSTQARLLAEHLRGRGHTVCLTREPGGCPTAESIRGLLFNGTDWQETATLFLMLAARVEHAAHTIRPALARGEIVICDRFTDSTLVYQGTVGGTDLEQLREMNSLATGGLQPDLTFLLDAPVEVTLPRLPSRGEPRTFFDDRAVDFHQQIRKGFLDLAEVEPERFTVVNASPDPATIQSRLQQVIHERLGL